MSWEAQGYDKAHGFYRLQGDDNMYSEDALQQRKRLRNDPEVIAMMYKFVNAFQSHKGSAVRIKG